MESKIDKFLKEIEISDEKCVEYFSCINGLSKLRKKLEKEKKFLITVKNSVHLFAG